MTSARGSKIKIGPPWHITIATNDIDNKVKAFWHDLGVGPWQFLTVRSPKEAVRLNGKPAAIDVRAAGAQVGFLMIGYDMPMTTPSPFDDVIEKRGSGGHHLAFIVDDFEPAYQHMRKLGYNELLLAHAISPDGDGIGCYFDTIQDMGTIIEFSKLPASPLNFEQGYPVDPAKVQRGDVGIQDTVHVAIVVHDVEKAVRCYEEALGVGPWQFITLSGHATYRGAKIDYSVKAAVARAGTYVLALEQPLSESGPLQDFLAKNGQGIHHICFQVDDVHHAAALMKRRGYDELFSVWGFGPNKDGDAVYFDTEDALGIVIELAKVPTGLLT